MAAVAAAAPSGWAGSKAAGASGAAHVWGLVVAGGLVGLAGLALLADRGGGWRGAITVGSDARL